MTNEKILYMLINVYANNKTNRDIAEEIDCHRNTVSKFVNRYSFLRNDIISLVKLNTFGNENIAEFCRSTIAIDFINKNFNIPHKAERSTEMLEAILVCCDKHLNYCIAERSIVEFVNKILNTLAKKYGMDIDSVKRDILSMSYTDISCLDVENLKINKKYKRDIRYYRNYNKVPKNFKEVYEEFKKEEIFMSNPISYGFFYGYARQFWGCEEFKYSLIDVIKE